jgi:hypothetical protein
MQSGWPDVLDDKFEGLFVERSLLLAHIGPEIDDPTILVSAY